MAQLFLGHIFQRIHILLYTYIFLLLLKRKLGLEDEAECFRAEEWERSQAKKWAGWTE